MSDTTTPPKYRPPQAVLDNAQAALTLLAAEDAALAARVAKILTGYAVRLHQRGEDTSVENLIAAARKGAASLKDIFQQEAAPKSFIEHYAAIAAPLLPASQEAKPIVTHTPIYDAKADIFPNRPPMMGWNAGGVNDGYGREYTTYDRHDIIRERDMAHFERRQEYYGGRSSRKREINSFANMMRALHLPEHDMRVKAFHFLLRDPEQNHYAIITTALQMGRLRLVSEILPIALKGMHGHEMQFINNLIDCLPHSNKILIKFTDHAPPLPVMRTMLTVLTHDKAPQELIHHAIKTIATMPPDVRVRELGSKLPEILKLRPHLADPIFNDILITDQSRFADRRILHAYSAHAADDAFEAILQSPLIKKFAWDGGFLSLISGVTAPRILRLAAIADAECLDWRDTIDTDSRAIGALPEDPAAMAALLHVIGEQATQDLLPRLMLHASQLSDAATRARMITHIIKHPACTNERLYEALLFIYRERAPNINRNDIYFASYLSALDFDALSEEQRTNLLTSAPSTCTLALLDKCAFTPWQLNQKMRNTHLSATYEENSMVAYRLVQLGADIGLLTRDEREIYDDHAKHFDRWMKIARTMPPPRMYTYDPTGLKLDLFHDVTIALQHEGYQDNIAYAYNTAMLLQSQQRVLQYLQKWGKPSRQPLHNLVQGMALPPNLGNANLNDWGDAILRHGPDMAKLAKFCASIPSPARGDDGGWSLSKTREIAATFAYPRGGEHPALAALCSKHSVKEDAFNRALDLVKTQPPGIRKDIPALDIDGTRFDIPNARFFKLADDDIRGLFLGELTDCCQSIGGVGAKCAEHGFTSPNAGFYVIETEKGEVIGQTWAWRGEKNELVFDSLEMLGGRVSAAQWQKLVTAVANDIAKKRGHKITALHVGTSGETPSSFAHQFSKAAEGAKPRDYTGYRDSNYQYVIWQKPESKYAKKPK